eukprot:1155084-Pelagomonas_calceolata.AAC.5
MDVDARVMSNQGALTTCRLQASCCNTSLQRFSTVPGAAMEVKSAVECSPSRESGHDLALRGNCLCKGASRANTQHG